MYRKKDMMIPRWFIDGWNSYGLEAMILPPNLLKAYETFKKEPNIPHLKISHIFCSSFIGFQISHGSLDENTR